jgi:hypothetical protein
MERYLEGIPYAKGGIDVPRWFIDELKSIDNRLDVIFHPFDVLYDDLINLDTGETENPRFSISWCGEHRVMGFVTSDGNGHPIEDGRFHVWRWCWPHGWAHIGALASRSDAKYLRYFLKRLKLQDKMNAMGRRAYRDMLIREQEEAQGASQARRQEMFDDTMDQNSGFVRKAMENFERGHVKPTNPQVERAMSYPGQTNRTKTSRPMTDEEGGLVLPEE